MSVSCEAFCTDIDRLVLWEIDVGPATGLDGRKADCLSMNVVAPLAVPGYFGGFV